MNVYKSEGILWIYISLIEMFTTREIENSRKIRFISFISAERSYGKRFIPRIVHICADKNYVKNLCQLENSDIYLFECYRFLVHFAISQFSTAIITFCDSTMFSTSFVCSFADEEDSKMDVQKVSSYYISILIDMYFSAKNYDI